jgi:hypothetical protein
MLIFVRLFYKTLSAAYVMSGENDRTILSGKEGRISEEATLWCL